jgi:hypothetical protein
MPTEPGTGVVDRKYELWREAVFFDDEPVYIDTFDTREEANEALVRRANFADLRYSEYDICLLRPGGDRDE